MKRPTVERIESKRLVLRRPLEDDLNDVFEVHGDPQTNIFNPSGPHPNIDKSKQLLDEWLAHWQYNEFGYWTVIAKETSQIIGFGGFKIEEVESEPILHLYYRFRLSAWGSGYASEMSQAAIDHIKLQCPGTSIHAIINPENSPSIKVAERLGMRFEREVFYYIPSRLYTLA